MNELWARHAPVTAGRSTRGGNEPGTSPYTRIIANPVRYCMLFPKWSTARPADLFPRAALESE